MASSQYPNPNSGIGGFEIGGSQIAGTGPDYPPLPVAGSNAIGKYQIGISPIGDIVPFNPWLMILSEYANSPIMDGIIINWFLSLDQTADFTAFYDNIWNIQTANGYGLDVWGRIVGVNRVIVLQTTRYWGYEEQELTTDPYQVSPFYSGGASTNNFALTDQSYRLLILAKAAANITNGSAPSINQILRNLFPGRGETYITDNEDMTMTYNFNFVLTDTEQAVVKQSGVLPKSTGVKALYAMFGVPF